MLVEECCHHLFRSLLPDIDPKHEGVAFDVGVGTFSFYCETFAKLGYRTIAVEPIPTDELKQICKRQGVKLFESVLGGVDDTVTLYIGSYEGAENTNLSSLNSDWWGRSTRTKQVSSMTLPTLLAEVKANKITCMKIDVEGSEQTILSQFPVLPQSQIPSVVMFEYGGGGQRQEQVGAWSEEYLASTKACLAILKQCGFEDSIVIEAASSQERLVNLRETSLTESEFFGPEDIYGNIIAFREFHPSRQKIADICRQYASNNPAHQNPFTKLLKLTRRLYERR